MNFKKIKSITPTKSVPVYHLTMEKNHNFFANSLCVHNCDYYNNSKNEGEIFVKFHNQGPKDLIIPVGDAMCQAIFSKYLVTDTDSSESVRNGGFGSTSS